MLLLSLSNCGNQEAAVSPEAQVLCQFTDQMAGTNQADHDDATYTIVPVGICCCLDVLWEVNRFRFSNCYPVVVWPSVRIRTRGFRV